MILNFALEGDSNYKNFNYKVMIEEWILNFALEGDSNHKNFNYQVMIEEWF